MPIFDPRVLGAVPSGLRRERIESSPRYRDGQFHNTAPLGSPMAGQPFGKRMSIMGELFFGRGRRTPPGPLPVESPLAAWSRAAETGLRVTWLGHSTVLLEIDGIRVLTDPVWGERVSPVGWAGPQRFHRAPARIGDLPKLDAVLISHDHYDHLDYPTVVELARLDVPFITSLGVGAHLEAWGIHASRITELIGGKRRCSPAGVSPSPPRRAATSRGEATAAIARLGRRGRFEAIAIASSSAATPGSLQNSKRCASAAARSTW